MSKASTVARKDIQLGNKCAQLALELREYFEMNGLSGEAMKETSTGKIIFGLELLGNVIKGVVIKSVYKSEP